MISPDFNKVCHPLSNSFVGLLRVRHSKQLHVWFSSSSSSVFFNLNINLIILFHHVITAFIFICFFYLFIYLFSVLSFVQFEPNLRDKRLKVNGIGSPALGRLSSLGRGEGGAWYSTNVYTRGLCPEFEHLTLLYTIFHEKSTPFVYLLLTNGNFQFWLVNISTAHDLARSLAS